MRSGRDLPYAQQVFDAGNQPGFEVLWGHVISRSIPMLTRRLVAAMFFGSSLFFLMGQDCPFFGEDDNGFFDDDDFDDDDFDDDDFDDFFD
jgi:hypothetical protein